MKPPPPTPVPISRPLYLLFPQLGSSQSGICSQGSLGGLQFLHAIQPAAQRVQGCQGCL